MVTDTGVRTSQWTPVCHFDELINGTGACAVIEGWQIALFRVANQVYALDNFDPFSKVNVLSKGIVGDREGVLKVASPIYKQCFCLETGVCLDDSSVRVNAFPVRVKNGIIEVLPSPKPAEC